MTVPKNEEQSVESVLSDAGSRMSKAVEILGRDLGALRTGRANPSLVEDVSVDYYGVPTPLNQMATISAPEARLIMIQPWDKQALFSIEKGLLRSDMGLNPANDGALIRVPIPPLTQDRRREMVRMLGRKVEDAKLAVRNVRRDAQERLRGMERNKGVPQDEIRRAQEKLQKATDSHVYQVDQIFSAKEAEILQV